MLSTAWTRKVSTASMVWNTLSNAACSFSTDDRAAGRLLVDLRALDPSCSDVRWMRSPVAAFSPVI
jgi:hypothetical protein